MDRRACPRRTVARSPRRRQGGSGQPAAAAAAFPSRRYRRPSAPRGRSRRPPPWAIPVLWAAKDKAVPRRDAPTPPAAEARATIQLSCRTSFDAVLRLKILKSGQRVDANTGQGGVLRQLLVSRPGSPVKT